MTVRHAVTHHQSTGTLKHRKVSQRGYWEAGSSLVEDFCVTRQQLLIGWALSATSGWEKQPAKVSSLLEKYKVVLDLKNTIQALVSPWGAQMTKAEFPEVFHDSTQKYLKIQIIQVTSFSYNSQRLLCSIWFCILWAHLDRSHEDGLPEGSRNNDEWDGLQELEQHTEWKT